MKYSRADFKKKYNEACIRTLRHLVKKSKKNIISELLAYWNTWDNYGLSTIYLKILNYISAKGFYKNALVIKLSQLLLVNISPDPKKRKSVPNTLKTYTDLFYVDEKIANYDLLIENFDKEIFTKKAKAGEAKLKKISRTK